MKIQIKNKHSTEINGIFVFQTLETYRLIQQQNMLVKLKESLKIEQKQLLQQWLKSDFIEKFKAQL